MSVKTQRAGREDSAFAMAVTASHDFDGLEFVEAHKELRDLNDVQVAKEYVKAVMLRPAATKAGGVVDSVRKARRAAVMMILFNRLGSRDKVTSLLGSALIAED